MNLFNWLRKPKATEPPAEKEYVVELRRRQVMSLHVSASSPHQAVNLAEAQSPPSRGWEAIGVFVVDASAEEWGVIGRCEGCGVAILENLATGETTLDITEDRLSCLECGRG